MLSWLSRIEVFGLALSDNISYSASGRGSTTDDLELLRKRYALTFFPEESRVAAMPSADFLTQLAMTDQERKDMMAVCHCFRSSSWPSSNSFQVATVPDARRKEKLFAALLRFSPLDS